MKWQGQKYSFWRNEELLSPAKSHPHPPPIGTIKERISILLLKLWGSKGIIYFDFCDMGNTCARDTRIERAERTWRPITSLPLSPSLANRYISVSVIVCQSDFLRGGDQERNAVQPESPLGNVSLSLDLRETVSTLHQVNPKGRRETPLSTWEHEAESTTWVVGRRTKERRGL